MKKLMLFSGLMVMLVAVTSFGLAPREGGSNKAASGVSATSSIPDDVMAVVKNSCMGCHATGGKGMAMAKVNFSEWDTYPAAKQAKKAEAVCNVLTKGSMPPKSFRASHPEAVPTDAQKDMICKWSKSLAAK